LTESLTLDKIQSLSIMTRLPADRRQQILQFLERHGSARTVELSRVLGSSVATVRRDLEALTEQRLIERTHGGALLARMGTAQEPPYALKTRRMRAEKEAIGDRAAQMVPVGSTVILDSGTTALALARRLAGRRLTVIALDLPVAQAAADGQTEVLVVGGRVRNGLYSLVGPWSEGPLASLHADLFFLGADAVDDDAVTNSTVDEAAIKRLAMRAARETILIADHSKFGRRALTRVCLLDDLSAVVTDRGIGDREATLRERVRQVVIV
jgi:DeoR/GlpR family transcriptional regulator of sugar metabolism